MIICYVSKKIKEKIGVETPVDIYFCGPNPMRDSLKKNLKNSGVSGEFSF